MFAKEGQVVSVACSVNYSAALTDIFVLVVLLVVEDLSVSWEERTTSGNRMNEPVEFP